MWHRGEMGTQGDTAHAARLQPRHVRSRRVAGSSSGRSSPPEGATHWVFAVLASVAIAGFIAAIPAGFGLDEQGHANRAWQLSDGIAVPERAPTGPAFGGVVPDVWQRFHMIGWYWSNTADRSVPLSARADFQERDLYAQVGSAPLPDNATRSFQDFTNTGITSPLAYAPAALGIWAARTANLNVHDTYQAGRVANGAMYVALGTWAIWLLRRSRLRWFYLGVGLLPTAIFQSSVYSSDTYTNGVTLVFLAAVTAILVDRRTARPTGAAIAIAFGSGLALALAKPAYAPICLVFLLLPAAAFGSRRRKWIVSGSFLGAAAGLVVAWTALTSDILDALYLQTPWPDAIDSQAQLEGLLAEPLRGAGVLATSVGDFGWLWLTELPAQFGYNNVKLPFPWWLLAYLSLLAAAYAGPKLRRRDAVIFLGLAAVTGLAVIMSLYLTFNPVGAATTVGVHPRYFFPLLPLVIPAVTSLLPGRLPVSDSVMATMVPVAASAWLAVSLTVWLQALW